MAETLGQLAAGMRRAADDVPTTTQRALAASGPRLVDAARAGARILPRRGGLAARVAGARFTVDEVRGAGSAAGIRLTVAGDLDLEALDAGTVHHPVHGNRRVWVTQRVPAGWLTKAVEEIAADETVRDRLAEDVARSIATS